MLAGHSLGEYTALVCANALTFAAGLKLVAKRGELMQQAVAPGAGAMAAILGLDLPSVQKNLPRSRRHGASRQHQRSRSNSNRRPDRICYKSYRNS